MEKRIVFSFEDVVRINFTCSQCGSVYAMSDPDHWTEVMDKGQLEIVCRFCLDSYHAVRTLLRRCKELHSMDMTFEIIAP